MDLTSKYLLILLLLPFISAALIAMVSNSAASLVSIGLAGLFFLVCLAGWGIEGLEYQADWFKPMGLTYNMRLDSYSYFLILLSGLLTLLCLFYSHKVVQKKVKAYHALFHALQGTVVASLLSNDLFFFYVFFEAMLIPMYFLIGIWGGKNRLYATTKFFLFTLAGSLLMLVGLISTYVLYFSKTGEWSASFDVLRIYFSENPIPIEMQLFMFISFFLAFAIKVPLFPFHTWLPDAHTEAPTAGSVILAGVLLKIGTYGLMRFAIPLFPDAAAQLSTSICILSVVGIIAGALVAWRQTDMKKLIAYSSVSHLGFVMLGIFSLTSLSWNGAYLQMINHGISTGALFFLIGFIYDQKHSRDIETFGRLAKVIPLFSLVFVVVSLSSVALPGTNGFVGEFLILLGGFQSQVVSSSWIVVASTGVILSAIYMLHLVQKLCYGEEGINSKGLKDLGIREFAIYVPLILLIFAIGFFPSWLLEPVSKTTQTILGSLPTYLR